MPLTFPAIIPSPSSKKSIAFKTLRADFGDGYNQTAPDGINYRRIKWKLVFNDHPIEEIQQVADFMFDRGNNESFYWTEPYGTTERLWKCTSDVDIDFQQANAGSVSFEIEEQFL